MLQCHTYHTLQQVNIWANEFGKCIQWELEQELAGRAGILKNANTTKLLTLPYKILAGRVNATEINAASRGELVLGRRAGRDGENSGQGKGRRNDCVDVREDISFLKSGQYTSTVEWAGPPPLTYPYTRPVLRLTGMEESEEKLGNTFSLRPELNAVSNSVVRSQWHPNLSLGR